ncbi:uncharacterized protein N7498_007055 [Penicillium cinerascens]|uniref:Rhodopsin domain-containing protein n=1 Tax=Penicillium cinerascens TaxID=70096 RepID=A0A9W9JJ71_9EURO|nr:uncharacterized protein N7498_007055 [Penicillium cinerascens]KAJ5197938.1 hypothetical protein N7498_007055 [Penicillium cinerascens]
MNVLPTTTVFTILAILFVLVRLWTRIWLIKSPGYDDLLVTLALLSSITFYAFIIVQREYGLGVSRQDLPQEDIRHQMLYLWLSIPFYNLSLVLSKLSALVLYARIFRYRGFLIANYTLMAFLIVAGLWMVISGFAFCSPVSAFWSGSKLSVQKHCLPTGPVWFTNAGMQIFTDVVILVMPMFILSKLKLPKRQKAGIMVVFGVGIFVIATSSARLYELVNMVNDRDFTKTNQKAAVWSSLEANVSIICACLPPLHPFISRIFSFCFRPQPLHSSPANKQSSNTTELTSTRRMSRKTSFYDSGKGPDGGIFYNDVFFSGPGEYSATIAKMDNAENNTTKEEPEGDPDAIRVVRELRVGSDPVAPSMTVVPDGTHDRDFEAELNSGSGGEIPGAWNTAIEWDLGDFEFPDYKERMNAPI